MKHPILALALIAAAAPAAAADTFALDYKANDPSCIDAARFADEVSAKLGFVPWAPAAKAAIRVRVERDGAQFTGTFRNVNGAAKIVDGQTCKDVTSSLVVTVATAVDTMPKLAATKPAPLPAATSIPGGTMPVTFISTDGARVDVGIRTGSGVAVATNGTAAVAAYFEPVCTTPCKTRLPPGRNYLQFSDPDPDALAVGGGSFIFDNATTIRLTHESRHNLRLGLFGAGAAMTVIGVILLAQGSTLGGTLLASFGTGAMVTPLWIHDTFSTTQGP
jgi:hypothetical protein